MKVTEFCLKNRTTTLFLTIVAIAAGNFVELIFRKVL